MCSGNEVGRPCPSWECSGGADSLNWGTSRILRSTGSTPLPVTGEQPAALPFLAAAGKFNDEKAALKLVHDGPGVVGMANSG